MSFDWDIDWRGQPASDRTSGNSQVVYNAFPRWVGSPQILLRKEQIRNWRAFRATAQGRVGIYRIRLCDPVGFGLSETGAGIGSKGVPFSTSTFFSADVGFAYDPKATVNIAADAGSEQLTITSPDVAPKVGQIMSYDDWPFQVTTVRTTGADTYSIGIQMPLRSAITAGESVSLAGIGRFEAVEDGMGNPTYGAAHVSTPRLQFREVLTR
ncbi:hypothetical protein [Ruegeria jejuensis]|uniref:hypothetical protein n=1 Tax=Ruegeria jejuensis TaxID=3233338 RepID=UPI00355B8A80